MNRFRKLAFGLGTAFAVLAGSVGIVAAADTNQTVSGNTNSSIYKTGQSVTITGTVNGDIYCAGQTIDINATVNGDVLCAGQSVTVNGQINGNLRVAGQTVNVGAKVERSATITAQDATFASNASVGNDLTLATQTANVDGVVGRDLNGAVNTLFLRNSIGRNVDVKVAKLELSSGAKIAGNLSYTSPSKLQKTNGATIGGTVSYHVTTAKNHNHFNWTHALFVWDLYLFAALLFFSMILVALFPQALRKSNELASEKLWATILTGFIAMIIVPTLLTVLSITVIGIPTAVIIGVTWLLALILSVPLSGYYVGRLILKREKRAPLIMLLGTFVLGIIWLIPLVGFIVAALATWFGTGSILLNLKRAYKKPVYESYSE